MANLTITNNNIGNVILQDQVERDDTITFAGADTYVEGTILARQEVDLVVAAAADVGNTGDGTVTSVSVVKGDTVPLVGAYTLVCTDAVVNGGVFKLLDPNNSQVAADLRMTPAPAGSTVLRAGGLKFTITDGATDFVAGDFFTLTVAADGKLTAFATDGAGGAQYPVGILTYEVEATGAGDIPVRMAVAGRFHKSRLVIDADGDDSNIDAKVIDQLRHIGLLPIDATELNFLDNQ